jgi:hypothetical protein
MLCQTVTKGLSLIIKREGINKDLLYFHDSLEIKASISYITVLDNF